MLQPLLCKHKHKWTSSCFIFRFFITRSKVDIHLDDNLHREVIFGYKKPYDVHLNDYLTMWMTNYTTTSFFQPLMTLYNSLSAPTTSKWILGTLNSLFSGVGLLGCTKSILGSLNLIIVEKHGNKNHRYKYLDSYLRSGCSQIDSCKCERLQICI